MLTALFAERRALLNKKEDSYDAAYNGNAR